MPPVAEAAPDTAASILLLPAWLWWSPEGLICLARAVRILESGVEHLTIMRDLHIGLVFSLTCSFLSSSQSRCRCCPEMPRMKPCWFCRSMPRDYRRGVKGLEITIKLQYMFSTVPTSEHSVASFRPVLRRSRCCTTQKAFRLIADPGPTIGHAQNRRIN